ncbi:MAG TPA: sensor histidine kinase [Candidatus Hungatella pullicola]|nr:sensor histidine kinase [Candidatus Hungatella pullicola]
MNNESLLLFLSIVIVILIAIIVYQQFSFHRGTQSQIRQISQKLKEIIETDSGEQLMLFTGNKELIELSAQINALIERHRKTKADYRRSEISSRKMLSNISHDIKTPLTVILGYLEIMRLNGTATEEMLKKTEKKAQSVMELINQFFTLAKLEAGDMNMEISKIDVCEICRESVLDFYEILTQNGFEVDISIPETSVYIPGNNEGIRRILFNLISNVVRYGADGKYLGIFLRNEEKRVCIDVIDKGKGIDKQFADRIFDRLFTLEDSRNRSIQGNGLGLTIARTLALQMEGTLTVESKPYVRTIFRLTLKKSNI